IYQVGGDGKHILAGEATRLAFLGDMISIPGKFGYIAKFVSIGDLFVVMGIFALILQILLENESKDKSEGNLAGHK
ncbi:MAG: DUF5317 domain-containing protein, partial [Syntrophales bacterium]|nr:DUF5317 domain-containing protein [Syntrophales bacterium]